MDGNMQAFLKGAGALALIEGISVGLLFSGVMVGAGFVVSAWLMSAGIISASAFGAAALIYAPRPSGPGTATAWVALAAGAIVGFVVGYLLQPVAGPV